MPIEKIIFVTFYIHTGIERHLYIWHDIRTHMCNIIHSNNFNIIIHDFNG